MAIIRYYDVDNNVCETDTKEYVELLNEAIQHYERMIEWARAKDPDSRMHHLTMYKELKESWLDEHCVLCNKFEYCYGCPIYERNAQCKNCFNTPWQEMNDATNCGEWLIHAEEEVKLLSTLRYHYGNLSMM